MESTRDTQLIIRLNQDEKDAIKECADLAGLGMSAWARERLRMDTIQELRRAGRVVPFVADVKAG